MGVSASKNESLSKVFNESISSTLNSTMISIAQSSTSDTDSQQVITIQAKSRGSVTIDGIVQKTVANISVDKFLSHVNSEQLSTMLTSAVDTAVKDNQEIEQALTIGGAVSSNVSDLESYTRNVQEVVNSYSYTQFVSDVNSIFAKQTITLELEAGEDIDVSNISQFLKAELLSKQIAEVMTEKFTEVISDTKSSVTKVTEQASSSGISSAAIVFIVIFIIVGLLAGFFVYRKFIKGGELSRMDPDWRTLVD